MSGICGICRSGGRVEPTSILEMLEAIACPGESETAKVGGSGAVLGAAKRWSFQQVAAIPGVQIAADAELFNLEELRNSLGNGKSQPSSLSVAETLAALYLEKGLDFVQSLDGVFSIAIWDERKQRLLLVIDRLGVNSLYWRRERGGILFATRVGGIRAKLNGTAEVNAPALMQYLLFSAVPAPLSIYKGIEKLQPGHILIFENDQVTQHKYWDLEFAEEQDRSEEYWANQLQNEMRRATVLHAQGCRIESIGDSKGDAISGNAENIVGKPENVGAYLSGGTDSSSVVAFLSEWRAPAKSFSIFFAENRYNEINYARIAAKRFGTKHYELCLKPADALEALPLLTRYYDEPFANSSAIGGYFCARLARENGVDTLLAGDGGDELFAGNERYASDKQFALYHRVPRIVRKGLIEPVASLLPADDGKLSLPRRYIRRAQILNPLRIFSYGLFLSTPPEQVFEQGFLESAPPEHWMDVAENHFAINGQDSELNRLLYLDVKMTLADNDLRKVLGTAELAGVRARFPLLDFRLAELSARIPARLKLKGFRKRYIFKRAMRDILPVEILKKTKHGFGVPVSLWFLQEKRLEELMKDVLNDARTRQRGYFQPGFYDQVMRQHREEDAKNYGELLWYLLILELWHRQHLETRTGAPHFVDGRA